MTEETKVPLSTRQQHLLHTLTKRICETESPGKDPKEVERHDFWLWEAYKSKALALLPVIEEYYFRYGKTIK